MKVVEEELSTVIAYSLSSQEYWEQVQTFLKEDTNDLIVKDRPYKNKKQVMGKSPIGISGRPWRRSCLSQLLYLT